MLLAANSKSERVLALCVKVCSCTLLASAAGVLLYFAFSDLAERFAESSTAAILNILLSLAFSGAMLLFLLGALRTSVEDYAIQIRILTRHGFRKSRDLTPEEFERLAAMERSIDVEIRERTRERQRSRK